MILSDTEVTKAIKARNIVIEPFRPECLGSNSYDVHLGKMIGWYEDQPLLDCKVEHDLIHYEIEPEGFVMRPGRLYLGVTEEYTETWIHVPWLDGKSSIGRLGMSIHVTAGRGDVGFCGYFTLEMTVVQPLRIYTGMPVGQLTYFMVDGRVERPYNKKPDAKYVNRDPRPQASRMYKNFIIPEVK